ncbi:unnamed protein product [Adineta steineri]|uniref:Uncharacterized protein n=1 Tax=Adineta steineri TaxID=433720 RepID=A0A819UY26_9BILA|nr:unnamed protein product [Adineta steineri]
MRSIIVLFFIIFLSSVTGQTTELPDYSCDENDVSIQFALLSSSHSAWNSISNCSLQQCNISLNGSDNCLSSSTPCFDYRTINNISYCAPAILCSILESCDNITQTCSSNDSVCVINSCCSSQAICLPLLATHMCERASTSTSTSSTSRTSSTSSTSTSTSSSTSSTISTTSTTSITSTSTSASTSTTSTTSTTSVTISTTTTMTTQNSKVNSLSNNNITDNTWTLFNCTYMSAISGNLTLKFTMTPSNKHDWYLDDASVKDPSSVEMLTNGDFESSPTLIGWYTGSGGAISSTQSHSPSHSFYASSNSVWISQSFNALSGVIYNVSYWIYFERTSNGNDPSAVLDVTIN